MKRALGVIIALLAVPRVALACPVCFGQTDSPLASAANLGILAMLVIVCAMLACFAAFMVYLNRRAKFVDAAPAARTAPAPIVMPNPQEGTAQC